MKKLVDTRRLTLYVWVGLAYMLLSIIGNMVSYHGAFGIILLNEIWRAVYIFTLNFIFFEYTLPFIRLHRKYILFKILIALFVLFAQLMLYSYGLYAWRSLGILLHMY